MNGASAALTLALAPPIKASIKATMPSGIEQRIGEAVADAGITVCLGVEDWKAGCALAPATRVRAGEHLGRVALLQLEHPGTMNTGGPGVKARR